MSSPVSHQNTAAPQQPAKAKKAVAKAEKDAAEEAAQAEKRMNAGLAARPGSRARTAALKEYYSADKVQAREENAAARCRAGDFGQASRKSSYYKGRCD